MPKPNKVLVEYVGEEAAVMVGETGCLPRAVVLGLSMAVGLLALLGWLEQAGVF